MSAVQKLLLLLAVALFVSAAVEPARFEVWFGTTPTSPLPHPVPCKNPTPGRELCPYVEPDYIPNYGTVVPKVIQECGGTSITFSSMTEGKMKASFDLASSGASNVIRCIQQRLPQASVHDLSERPTKPQIITIYSWIFYEGGVTKNLPVQLPDGAKSLIPARSGHYAMIGLRCSGISADRHLEGCEVDAEPKDMGYEAVGKDLVKQALVDPAFPLVPKLAIKFIDIQFRVENSDTQAIIGPCWPPSCILEPPPPPPPPRRSN